jgi:hypothetical protein
VGYLPDESGDPSARRRTHPRSSLHSYARFPVIVKKIKLAVRDLPTAYQKKAAML